MQLTSNPPQTDQLTSMQLAIFDPTRGVAPAACAAAAMHAITVSRQYPEKEQALEALQMGIIPDVMLVCWVPPERSALEFCRAVRAPSSSPCPFLPIIVICNEATREHVLAARDAGVDEFLVTPFTPKGFCDRLRAILCLRRGFVDVPGFFGPDRRRGAMAEMLGVDRRSGPSVLIDPRTGGVYVE